MPDIMKNSDFYELMEVDNYDYIKEYEHIKAKNTAVAMYQLELITGALSKEGIETDNYKMGKFFQNK